MKTNREVLDFVYAAATNPANSEEVRNWARQQYNLLIQT